MIGFDALFSAPVGRPGIEAALLAMTLAFVLGQTIAWTYVRTHSGLSYSRGFVQSIVLLTVIISVGMMVIGNSLAIAFGLIGALSVIRFRNILKDTRDTTFIFASLITGIATGTGSHGIAVAGTVAFCLLLFYLYWSGFGTRYTGDGFVRFLLVPGDEGEQRLREVFRRYCNRTQLVSHRFVEGTPGELAYRLSMRDAARAGEFVRTLQEVQGISSISFALQEDEAEV